MNSKNFTMTISAAMFGGLELMARVQNSQQLHIAALGMLGLCAIFAVSALVDTVTTLKS